MIVLRFLLASLVSLSVAVITTGDNKIAPVPTAPPSAYPNTIIYRPVARKVPVTIDWSILKDAEVQAPSAIPVVELKTPKLLPPIQEDEDSGDPSTDPFFQMDDWESIQVVSTELPDDQQQIDNRKSVSGRMAKSKSSQSLVRIPSLLSKPIDSAKNLTLVRFIFTIGYRPSRNTRVLFGYPDGQISF